MLDLTVASVTDTVLAQMANTPDPRLRDVMASLVRHMHEFARDVSLTPDEWLAAIRFLTQVGHACTPARQEFILLSDVLGLSALVNLLHDKAATDRCTESSLLGPFYRQDAPLLALGDSIAATATGPELLVSGTVADLQGRPVPGAVIQVWQTDAAGRYDLQIGGGREMDMRGNFRADAGGHFHFRTLRPLGYLIPMDGPVGSLIQAQRRHGFRPAHIHFLVSAPDHQDLVTALYLADDPHIRSDTVFGVARALVVTPVAAEQAAQAGSLPALHYDFRLSPASGTGSGRVGADPTQLTPAR